LLKICQYFDDIHPFKALITFIIWQTKGFHNHIIIYHTCIIGEFGTRKIGHIKMCHIVKIVPTLLRLYYTKKIKLHLSFIIITHHIFQNWGQKINVHLVSPTHLSNLPHKLSQEMKTLFSFSLVNILQNMGPNENLLFLYHVVSPFISKTKKTRPFNSSHQFSFNELFFNHFQNIITIPQTR
jgi:hypothetical protein